MVRNGEQEVIMKEEFFVSFKVFYQHSKERRLEKNLEKSQTGQPLTIPNTVPATSSHNVKWEQKNQQIKNETKSNFLTQPEQVFQCAVVMVLFSNVVTPCQNFCHHLVGKVSHSNSVLP